MWSYKWRVVTRALGLIRLRGRRFGHEAHLWGPVVYSSNEDAKLARPWVETDRAHCNLASFNLVDLAQFNGG